MDYQTSIVLFITFLCLYIAAIWRRRSKLPPGPVPLPIIGNFFSLGFALHKSFAELAAVYGPLMTIQLGSVTTVIASSPEMAKQVLQVNDQSFSSRTVPDALRALDYHKNSLIWLPAGGQWRNIRKLYTIHFFTKQKLDSSQGLRIQKVDELVAYVDKYAKDGRPLNVGQVVFSTVVNLLSSTVFSKDITSLELGFGEDHKALIRSFSVASAKPNLGDYFPILRRFDLQGIRGNVARLFQMLHNLFDECIQERLEARESGTSTTSDFLDTILDYRHEDGSPLSRAEIYCMLKDVFIAGPDTTTNTLEWALAELLHHPEEMAKVKQEIDEKIGKGNPIDDSSIDKLPYLEAVMKETFRLHPPVPYMIPHRAEADVEIAGCLVPKNTQVFVNMWAIGRDPKIYDKPTSFRPQRFLDVDMDFKGRHFELIPFGAGRRMCPGMPLGTRMTYLMLIALLHNFDWKLEKGLKPADMDMEENPGLTLQKTTAVMVIPIRR